MARLDGAGSLRVAGLVQGLVPVMRARMLVRKGRLSKS